MPATIFNSLLLLIPLIAVNILVASFSGASYQGEPSAERLAESRRAIDRAFDTMTTNGSTARAEWAAMIKHELDDRNMSAVRGFLLGAPQMLNPEDQRAIEAAAAADPSGSEDERLLRAALLFVPSDIRVGYEASIRPRGMELVNLQESEEIIEPVTLAAIGGGTGAIANLSSMTHTPAFSVLGNVEDLVSRSRDWMRGNHQHAFEMRLTGIAMATPPSATGLQQDQLIEAASVLKTAWRSDRLRPQYRRHLESTLTRALPDAALEANLETALAEVATLDVRARHVQDAFAKSVDQKTAERLGPEFAQIAEIAKETSARGAISLIEQAGSASDISRARLVARAGGDRAVAVVSRLGPEALKLTGSGITWSRTIVLNIMMLAAAGIALVLCAFSALGRMIFGRRVTAIL